MRSIGVKYALNILTIGFVLTRKREDNKSIFFLKIAEVTLSHLYMFSEF